MIVLYLLAALGVCQASIVNPEVTPVLSWWDARSYCKREFNSDLLIPDGSLNISSLTPDRFYWIGALETYKWKWKDGSDLIDYRGYAALSDHETVPTNLSDNSVNTCSKTCKPGGLIGLSGITCYCFDFTSFPTTKVDADPCPGNPEDKCGNATGMSLYKTDKRFVDGDSGWCAFGNRYDVNGSDVVRIHRADCKEELYFLCNDTEKKGRNCSGDICSSRRKNTWKSANQHCNLITVTNMNEAILHDFFEEFVKQNYWIGLQKIITRKWTNGQSVYGSPPSSVAKGQKCLAMWSKGSTYSSKFLSCDGNYSALCATNNIPTGTRTTVVTEDVTSESHEKISATETTAPPPPTTTTTTAGITFTAEETSTGEEASLTHSSHESTSSYLGITGPINKDETKNQSINGVYLYVGIGVGGVLLLASAIGALLFCKRRQNKENNTVRDVANTTRGKPESPPDSVKPENNDDTYDTTRPQKTLDDPEGCYNHLGAFEDGTYDTAGFKPGNRSLGGPQNNIYDTARPQHISGDTEDCYNHLSGLNEGTYDTAGVGPRNIVEDNTYDHVATTKP